MPLPPQQLPHYFRPGVRTDIDRAVAASGGRRRRRPPPTPILACPPSTAPGLTRVVRDPKSKPVAEHREQPLFSKEEGRVRVTDARAEGGRGETQEGREGKQAIHQQKRDEEEGEAVGYYLLRACMAAAPREEDCTTWRAERRTASVHTAHRPSSSRGMKVGLRNETTAAML